MDRKTAKNLNPDGAVQKGYLIENFRVFHIDSEEKEPIPPHFHSFHKVILVLKGNLRYVIEGVECLVKPGQILLVPAFSIHQPLIGPGPYERIVLWISPEAPEAEGAEEAFHLAEEDGSFVFSDPKVEELLRKLGEAGKEAQYGEEKLRSVLLTEALIYAARNREAFRKPEHFRKKEPSPGSVRDPLVREVLEYIRLNLEQDLGAGKMAEKFYVSESTLTGKFRKATGLSLHQYVLQKRLILAARLMREGTKPVTAAGQAGFSDYSTFYRAFCRYFEISPKEF